MDYSNVDVIMCGNPGVGKSTLLSSISKVPFRSGISFGTGLTAKLEFKESLHIPGTRFGDTPGLADIEMAKRAAEAITEALQDGADKKRNAKIFFVVMETNGRVRPDDLFTINQVMSSIKLPNGKQLGQNEYGVIVNQCALMDHPRFDEGREKIEAAFYTPSKSLPYATTYIKFLPRVAGLMNKEDAQFLFDKEFFEWIFNLPGINVASAETIDVSDIDEKLAKAREQHQKDLEAITKKLSDERDEMRRVQRDMMREMREKIKESKREKEELEERFEQSKTEQEEREQQIIKDMEEKLETVSLGESENPKRRTTGGDIFEVVASIIPLGAAIVKGIRAIGNF